MKEKMQIINEKIGLRKRIRKKSTKEINYEEKDRKLLKRK